MDGMAQRRFIVFSDSVGVGQYISPHKTWVHKLSEALGDEWLVINASRNGDTTRLALERMRYDVLSQKPDIVYIQFGINDANIWQDANGLPRVSLNSFYNNLIEIMKRCRVIGAVPYLGTNDNMKVEGYNGAIRAAGIACNERVIIHSYGLPTLLDDGVHLSEVGHGFYFERIRDEIDWT